MRVGRTPVIVLASLTACLAGCADSSIDAAFKNLFKPRLTPQQHMILAVSDADPDVRRESVAKIAKSKQASSDWAIKGFIAIALLESDPQARCVAVRALGKSGDPRALETCLKLINYRDYPPREVRPPDDLCRGDATLALAELSNGHVPDEQRGAVRQTLIDRLRGDTDRNVRMAAARGLRWYQEDDVLQALIEGLRDDAFTVVHECENSLAWLTGVTHNCDAYAWQQWYDANRERAFADAGEMPASRRPAYTNRWQKMAHDTRQVFRWLFPGKKQAN